MPAIECAPGEHLLRPSTSRPTAAGRLAATRSGPPLSCSRLNDRRSKKWAEDHVDPDVLVIFAPNHAPTSADEVVESVSDEPQPEQERLQGAFTRNLGLPGLEAIEGDRTAGLARHAAGRPTNSDPTLGSTPVRVNEYDR